MILPEGEGTDIRYAALDQALAVPQTELRLFGKPAIQGRRRMGVALARGGSIEDARDRARRAAATVVVSCH